MYGGVAAIWGPRYPAVRVRGLPESHVTGIKLANIRLDSAGPTAVPAGCEYAAVCTTNVTLDGKAWGGC